MPIPEVTAANNTKVELVTEAIETLINTIVAPNGRHALRGDDARRQYELVLQARAAVADSLRLLLQPTLRAANLPQEMAVETAAVFKLDKSANLA